MNNRQKELIVDALNARICYIETGTVTHRATDAASYNRALPKNDRGNTLFFRDKIPIKALDSSQLKLIVELQETIDNLSGDNSE